MLAVLDLHVSRVVYKLACGCRVTVERAIECLHADDMCAADRIEWTARRAQAAADHACASPKVFPEGSSFEG